jgi:hypothetical protein
MKTKCIYKGFRRPLFWFFKRRLFSTNESFTIVYHVNFLDCKYKTKYSINQIDWNKLCGISSEFNPHIWSFRFAWRWNDKRDTIELCNYAYINHRLKISNIKALKSNVNYVFYINYDKINNQLEMTINGNNKEIYKDIINPFYYKENGMYFGGTETCPKKIKYKFNRYLRYE